MKEATQIPSKVREAVYERDSYDGAPNCIVCGRPYPELHHFIERSRGGMGIEENLVCLCHLCHQRYHNTGSQEMIGYMRNYLRRHYKGWDESKLIKEK